MTVVWRLSSSRHPPLAGEGSRLVGGRWNSPGIPLVYASESIALCLAECLVHISGRLPKDYAAYQVALPADAIEVMDSSALKPDWVTDTAYTRAIGDQWVQQERSLALAVPSAILIESTNILINPGHPLLSEVGVARRDFRFDPRLRLEP